MAFEILNAARSKSTIRVVGPSANVRINLNQLSTNTQNEIITSASINQFHWSTSGVIEIYRGNDATGTLVIQVFGEGSLPLSVFDISVANTSTANIYFVNTGAGTAFIGLTKQATYVREPDTGFLV
jgi:hypothetical protein